MGDRHGGRFARRGRALSPTRPQVDAHRGVRFRWRATVFRCRGVVGRIYPRRNTPLGEGLPKRRTSKRICPAREGSPRRKHPDTAHERKDLPRAGTRPSAKASRHGTKAKGFARARTLSSTKASRHGARAKGFAPRENTPLGEGLPTRRTSERICPAQKHAPRRRPPDTAHERKNLPRGVRPRPTCRRTAGRPRPTDSRKTPLRRGRTHSARPLPSSFT